MIKALSIPRGYLIWISSNCRPVTLAHRSPGEFSPDVHQVNPANGIICAMYSYTNDTDPVTTQTQIETSVYLSLLVLSLLKSVTSRNMKPFTLVCNDGEPYIEDRLMRIGCSRVLRTTSYVGGGKAFRARISILEGPVTGAICDVPVRGDRAMPIYSTKRYAAQLG